MSFSKLRSPRMCDATSKGEVPSPSLGNSNGSHTSLASQKQLLSTTTKTTQRSRSLSMSNRNGRSSTCLSATASKSVVASKIPVQSKVANSSVHDKHPIAKRSPSAGERSKAKSLSRAPSPVSGVKSSANTVTKKTLNTPKLSRASTPNAAFGTRSTTVANTPMTPRTRSPHRVPGRLNQAAQAKKPSSAPKGKALIGAKKDAHKIENDVSTLNATPKNEEIIKEINLSDFEERKPYEKVPRPKEVKIDMHKINDLLNIISQECFLLCSELSEHKNIIFCNLIEFVVNANDDPIMSEKIANYLHEGDGMLQRYKLLKQSQHDISGKLYVMISELNAETTALRNTCSDQERKLELLEVENNHNSKQMKLLSEELDAEREKMLSMNQKKTQLEQQIKKHAQKIKELENKSSTSDGKIYQQISQLKSYEVQLKQKDEKYQLLEQKINQQAKQCRMATDIKDKLEKQRESLEARVSDLKKLKTEQQNESAKIEEKLRKELNEANRLLENEKRQREDLENELRNAHERIIEVQEKSLELADVTEVSKATIAHEGFMSPTEKEAQLYMDLNEVQQKLNKANEEIENFKMENEQLQNALFQATESRHNKAAASESPSVINVLKSELASKDEIIRSLQQQMETYMKEANTREQNLKEMEQKWNDDSAECKDTDKMVLWQEILELRHRLIQAEKDNEKHVKLLTQKQLEVEQRERVMQEQAKVLQVREELLKILRQKNKSNTGQMSALQAKLLSHERNSDMVVKFFSAKAEQLQEIYSTLEMKQRKVMQLEDEIKKLEAQNERGQYQRTRLEARIAELELALHENGRTSCVSSVYNPRCKPSTFSPPLYRSYYTHSLHREPEDVSDLPLSHQMNYPLQFPMIRPRHSNRLPHVSRKPYLRKNNKTRSLLELYKIHSSHWGDSSYSHTTFATPRCLHSEMHMDEENMPYTF